MKVRHMCQPGHIMGLRVYHELWLFTNNANNLADRTLKIGAVE